MKNSRTVPGVARSPYNRGVLPTSPNLSETTYDLLKLNTDGYRSLVVHGPGNAPAYARLLATDGSKLINAPAKDHQMLQGVQCGLWLWHDWLQEAHRLAQGMDSETGSFWHAI